MVPAPDKFKLVEAPDTPFSEEDVIRLTEFVELLLEIHAEGQAE